LANHDACSFDPSRGPEYCHSFTHRIAFHNSILANDDAYSFDPPRASASQHPSSPPYADVHAHRPASHKA